MKTIKEWFETLPEPARSQALENMVRPNIEFKYLDNAIMNGFIWSESKEGYEYWDLIYTQSRGGEFNTK